MKPKTREAMQQLFAAKWNIPKAADYCGLSWRETKIIFSEYCTLHQPTYGREGKEKDEEVV